MVNEYVLTIAIITMNRAEQLSEAIHSCLLCKLPSKTQFVIIDNASTDNTRAIVENIKAEYSLYQFEYYYSPVNTGVGGGRNIAFELSQGKYIYFLDDDAIIAPECYDTFFIKCIELMDCHLEVASLSTNIYDSICGNARNLQRTFMRDELADIFSFRGGSHFLRRLFVDAPLYLNIRYGCEELMPSIYIWDRGGRNVYFDGVRVIHQPRINKWAKGTTHLIELSKLYIAMRYATYKLLYPRIFYPIIWLAMVFRCKKHFSETKSVVKECKQLAEEVILSHSVNKISVCTVVKLWIKFKWTVF